MATIICLSLSPPKMKELEDFFKDDDMDVVKDDHPMNRRLASIDKLFKEVAEYVGSRGELLAEREGSFDGSRLEVYALNLGTVVVEREDVGDGCFHPFHYGIKICSPTYGSAQTIADDISDRDPDFLLSRSNLPYLDRNLEAARSQMSG